ncbi:hypothetical protein IF2G_09035 [Cordyceps javanica]|nr:hypothetical protein IF2G_09035 [Cordyceps javanica]
MSDILGPLTTVFTPKPSCASHAGYTEFFNEDGGSYIVKGPVMTDGCYPPGFRPETNYYYTPGQCPAGYEGVAGRRTDYTETELCCPMYGLTPSILFYHLI